MFTSPLVWPRRSSPAQPRFCTWPCKGPLQDTAPAKHDTMSRGFTDVNDPHLGVGLGHHGGDGVGDLICPVRVCGAAAGPGDNMLRGGGQGPGSAALTLALTS